MITTMDILMEEKEVAEFRAHYASKAAEHARCTAGCTGEKVDHERAKQLAAAADEARNRVASACAALKEARARRAHEAIAAASSFDGLTIQGGVQ